ncbi:NAD(+)/NADH kinase [Halorussus halophilus]|uniref:NAD(+)/NADH kinase n=1 Tax=Halorussus halophilus TaxID=2650975 RepID=UPI001301266A|nr:NAD(+)/NADH kinase [Halorussus halophilus]
MSSAHDESTVGVVGEGSLTECVRSAVEAAGRDPLHGSAADVVAAGPEAVLAVGESPLLELVREGLDAPVLPIAAGPGYGGVAETEAERAVESLLTSGFETEPRATLSVSVGGEFAGRALADVTLVTTEPARISEYAVRSRGERVSCFRADGVTVSTPTGSHGYGRSAGGPLVEPGTGVVGVVPIAPFAVNVDHWVLDAQQPVTLSVERDEGEVSLLLDDRSVRQVPLNAPVELVHGEPLDVIRVPESGDFFDR